MPRVVRFAVPALRDFHALELPATWLWALAAGVVVAQELVWRLIVPRVALIGWDPPVPEE